MTKLSPTTLTHSDQLALLEVVQDRPREALIVSLALGTGLRLAEIVGLDVGDVYLPGGQPGVRRVRLRPGIAKRGRTGDPSRWSRASFATPLPGRTPIA